MPSGNCFQKLYSMTSKLYSMKKYLLPVISMCFLTGSLYAQIIVDETDVRNGEGYYTTLQIAQNNATDVKTLDIQKREADDFLENKYSFPTLENVFIHFSELNNFNSLKVNQNLKELRIMYSQNLKSLPDDITDLPKLETIAVYSCGLQKLPATFFNNTNLKEVCLCYNRLHDLPEIAAGSNIKKLMLDINSIDKLPPTFKNMKQLEVLGLRDCQFKTFPDEVLSLKKLKVLDLSANNISVLPDKISKLESLETLHLVRTGIRVLPASLRKSSLKYVAISDTGLTQAEKDNIIKSLPPDCQINWSTNLNYSLYMSSCACLKL